VVCTLQLYIKFASVVGLVRSIQRRFCVCVPKSKTNQKSKKSSKVGHALQTITENTSTVGLVRFLPGFLRTSFPKIARAKIRPQWGLSAFCQAFCGQASLKLQGLYTYVSMSSTGPWTEIKNQLVYSPSGTWIDCGTTNNNFLYVAVAAIHEPSRVANIYIDNMIIIP